MSSMKLKYDNSFVIIVFCLITRFIYDYYNIKLIYYSNKYKLIHIYYRSKEV